MEVVAYAKGKEKCVLEKKTQQTLSCHPIFLLPSCCKEKPHQYRGIPFTPKVGFWFISFLFSLRCFEVFLRRL